VLTQRVTTAGELNQILRGLPDATPLIITLNGLHDIGMDVGYGTDPTDFRKAIVLIELRAAGKVQRGAA
jgi:hypothetical protein